MRLKLSALLASTALVLSAAPVVSHAAPSKAAERHHAKVAFHHLSIDGLHAMLDVLNAQQALAAGNLKQASALLTHAQTAFRHADKQDTRFQAALADLHPQDAVNHAVAAQAQAQASGVAATWIPVGGEFLVSEALAPEKKETLKKANAQIKSGHVKEATETMKVLAEDVDFIVALAPLGSSTDSLNRAIVFANAKDVAGAQAALKSIVDSVAFVNENVLANFGANGPVQKVRVAK